MYSKISDRRGIALVSALGIAAILLVMALGLSFRTGMFTRFTGYAATKNAAYYSALSGLEAARDYLGRTFEYAGYHVGDGSTVSGPYVNGSKNYLSHYLDVDGSPASNVCASGGAEADYYRLLGSGVGDNPPMTKDDGTTVYPTVMNGVPYRVFIKDDRDGDGTPGCSDFEADNNNQIWILAQALAPDGKTAVTLEALAVYVGYKASEGIGFGGKEKGGGERDEGEVPDSEMDIRGEIGGG